MYFTNTAMGKRFCHFLPAYLSLPGHICKCQLPCGVSASAYVLSFSSLENMPER